MEHIEAEHPRPRHFLLHLSDPHLMGGPDPLYGAVDSEARLIQLFEEVRASGARPEAVIFTGDLADQGDPEAYAKLRAIVEPACEDMGAKVIWAMGNHDNRANFRAGLLDEPANDAPVDRSYFINGLRVITMDTSVPGLPPRRTERRQLEWLAQRAGNPCSRRHHPGAPPSAGPVRPGPGRAGGTPRPGEPGRRCPQLGCPDDSRRAPALLDHREFRRNSRLRGLGDVLHPGPQRGRRRYPRP